MKIKYVHTNIIASDWKKLAEFYINVFNCTPIYPERKINGKWLEKGTGVSKAELEGIHLILPGYAKEEPTLEIFQYNNILEKVKPSSNRAGIRHIAFHVDNVSHFVELVINNGGKCIGEIVTTEINKFRTLTFAYVTDPEGNIIEIQNWENNAD